MAEKVLHEVRIIETEDGYRIEVKGDKEKMREFFSKRRGFMRGGPFGHGPFRHGPWGFFGRHHHGPWGWGGWEEDEEPEAKRGEPEPKV